MVLLYIEFYRNASKIWIMERFNIVLFRKWPRFIHKIKSRVTSSMHVSLVVDFSCSVVSDSSQTHELQHIRLLCPSPTPRACSNSCPLSRSPNHLILYHPLFLLPSIFPNIRVFSNESALRIRWSMYWSFSFSISLSSEHSRLISFTIDWFDLLAVQGTLKSLLQHHSSKATIFLALSFLYNPTLTSIHNQNYDTTIALTRWTFVNKIMFLLFNMLSRVVIAFLPRSKHLLIS